MDNYPMGSNTPDAPWNQIDPPPCPECESDNVEEDFDGFKCLDCGHEWNYDEY